MVLKKTGLARTGLTLLALALLTGCTTYRVVQIGPGVSENNIVTPFYGMTRNNVLIPEYVLDEYGNYPKSEEEAEARFRRQRLKAEPIIKEKYDLPPTFPNQIPQYFLGFGLALVSPIVLPIQWMGESASPTKKKRSFSKIASDYYSSSFSSPGFEKPRIRERIDYFY